MKHFILIFGCVGIIAAFSVMDLPSKFPAAKKVYDSCKSPNSSFTAMEFVKLARKVLPDSPKAKCMINCMLEKGKMYNNDSTYDTFNKEHGKYRVGYLLTLLNKTQLTSDLEKVVDHCAKEAETYDTNNHCDYGFRVSNCSLGKIKSDKINLFSESKEK